MKKKWMMEDDGIISRVFVIDEECEAYIFPAAVRIKPSSAVFYDDHFEPTYLNVLKELKRGVSISKWKYSDYYDEFIERLKIDHPEYLV